MVADGHGELDVFAGEAVFGFAFDEVAGDFLGVLGAVGVGLELVAGFADALLNQIIAVGMHDAEFEVGGLLNLGLGEFLVGFGEAGELDEDAVIALRLDDWLGDAELVHALAEDFDGLGKDALVFLGHVGTGGVRAGGVGEGGEGLGEIHANEERGAALQVQAELELARAFALELVQDETRGVVVVLLGFILVEREVFLDVVRADGFHEVGELAFGVHLLQNIEARDNSLVGLVLPDGLDVEHGGQVRAGGRINLHRRPDEDDDDDEESPKVVADHGCVG